MSDDIEHEVIASAARIGIGADPIDGVVFEQQPTGHRVGVSLGQAPKFVMRRNYQLPEIGARSVE